ncbi:MAG: hypothetical protein K2W95_09835 [Candidatus Obscuribacterales bacterium]|nr:hypothetical protein [Candidatus Obscuribacterales bacterium]
MHAESSIQRAKGGADSVESPVFKSYEFHQGVISAKPESKVSVQLSVSSKAEKSADKLHRYSLDELILQYGPLDCAEKFSRVNVGKLQSDSAKEITCDMKNALLATPSQTLIYMNRIDKTSRSCVEVTNSISLDRATNLTAVSLFSTFIGRATEHPLTSEIESLASRAPGSAWRNIRALDQTGLRNLASWEHTATGKGRIPGANALLSKVQTRGAIRALGVIGCATAVNHILDQGSSPGQSGILSSAFDVMGAGFIAGMPLRLPAVVGIPARLAAITLGHQLARRAEASFFPTLR